MTPISYLGLKNSLLKHHNSLWSGDNPVLKNLQSLNKTTFNYPTTCIYSKNKSILMNPQQSNENNGNKDKESLPQLQELELEYDPEILLHIQNNTLVGKIYVDSPQNPINVKKILKKAWIKISEVKIRELEPNVFLFVFKNKDEMEDIYERRPWNVNYHHLSLQKWQEGMTLKQVNFDHSAFWIHITNVPLEFYTVKNATHISTMFPKLIEIELDDEGNIEYRNHIRMRVEVDLSKHIVVGFIVKSGKYAGEVIDFAYERLSDFYYNCGSFNHVMNGCKKQGIVTGNYRLTDRLRVIPNNYFNLEKSGNFLANFLSKIKMATDSAARAKQDTISIKNDSVVGLNSNSEISMMEAELLKEEDRLLSMAIMNSLNNKQKGIHIAGDPSLSKKVPDIDPKDKGKGKMIEDSPSPSYSPVSSPYSTIVLQSLGPAATYDQGPNDIVAAGDHASSKADEVLMPPPKEVSKQSLADLGKTSSITKYSNEDLSEAMLHDMLCGPDLAKGINDIDFLEPLNTDYGFDKQPVNKRPMAFNLTDGYTVPDNKRVKLTDHSPLLTSFPIPINIHSGKTVLNPSPRRIKQGKAGFVKKKQAKKGIMNANDGVIDPINDSNPASLVTAEIAFGNGIESHDCVLYKEDETFTDKQLDDFLNFAETSDGKPGGNSHE